MGVIVESNGETEARSGETAVERCPDCGFEGDDCHCFPGEPDLTCDHCSGTGGEPMDDYITPCEQCDGEGYRWWE